MIWFSEFPNYAPTSVVKKKHNLASLITRIDMLLTYVLQDNYKWKDGYQKTFYRLPHLFLSQATLGSLRSPISFSPCFTWELFRRLITSASSTYSKMPFIRTLFLSYDTSSVTKRASYTLSCVQRNRQNWILKWKNKTQYLYQWFFGFRVIQFFTGGKYLSLYQKYSVYYLAYPSDFLGEEQRRYGKTHRDWFSNGACIRCHCDKEGTLGHLILPLRIVAK